MSKIIMLIPGAWLNAHSVPRCSAGGRLAHMHPMIANGKAAASGRLSPWLPSGQMRGPRNFGKESANACGNRCNATEQTAAPAQRE